MFVFFRIMHFNNAYLKQALGLILNIKYAKKLGIKKLLDNQYKKNTPLLV